VKNGIIWKQFWPRFMEDGFIVVGVVGVGVVVLGIIRNIFNMFDVLNFMFEHLVCFVSFG